MGILRSKTADFIDNETHCMKCGSVINTRVSVEYYAVSEYHPCACPMLECVHVCASVFYGDVHNVPRVSVEYLYCIRGWMVSLWKRRPPNTCLRH